MPFNLPGDGNESADKSNILFEELKVSPEEQKVL